MIAQASRAVIRQAEYLDKVRRSIAKTSPIMKNAKRILQDDRSHNLVPWLVAAEPFFVAPEIADLIVTSAESIPDWPLREQDIPCAMGFVYLPCNKGFKCGDVALDALLFSVGKNKGGARSIEIWGLFDEPSAGIEAFTFGWEFGHTRAQRAEAMKCADDFEDEAQKVIHRLCAIFAAFVAFINQRVVSRHNITPNRAARRIAHNLVASSCSVVMLRRALHRSAGSLLENPREWSTRWWVGGHWRQQACGEARKERRPTWVSPYIKGPDDKPIRASRRLFAVMR